jgi:hypothetical protein
VKSVEAVRSTTPKRSATVFSDNEFMDTTRAWANEREDSWQHVREEGNEEGYEEEDDDESGYGAGSRYTFFPHRQGANRETTSEPDEP